jgi:hypothetical protein
MITRDRYPAGSCRFKMVLSPSTHIVHATALLKSNMLFAFYSALLLAGILSLAEAGTKLDLQNKSSKIATINWVNPDTRATVFFSSLIAGQSVTVNTYMGHEFQLVEMPDEETNVCEEATCKTTNFVVSKQDFQCKYRCSFVSV